MSLSTLAAIKMALDEIPAVPPARAAALLGVAVRTVYRKLDLGQLERVPRRGKSWVSARSIQRLLQHAYGESADFDALATFRDIRDGLAARDIAPGRSSPTTSEAQTRRRHTVVGRLPDVGL